MPRIPEADIERLKTEISVPRLIESAGIALKKSGKDLLGRCPFHEDGEPSLVVTPSKNLWHCFACQIGGGPIDWVMKTKGISFRHAVELLKADPSLVASPAGPVKRSTVRRLPPPVALSASDQELLDETIAYYHERLQQSPEALAYLQERGLVHPGLVDTFRLGLADRSLGLRLPEKNRKAGAELRARLQKIGLLRESGHEHFNGSLVIPIFDAAGHVVEVYGRKLRDDLRPGTPKHLYLPGPHAGVFNRDGLQGAREIILCEALIDALTFWGAGFRHVTAAYGVEGFSDEMLATFKALGIERVFIAFDADEAGERAADKLAARLIAEGLECLRVAFPKGMDANSYALKMTPAERSLGLVLRQARWLGRGADPRGRVPEVPTTLPAAPVADPLAPAASAPAEDRAPSFSRPPLADESVTPPAPSGDWCLDYGERRYRLRGWDKPFHPETLKVNVLVSRIDPSAGSGFHVDTLDLYSAKARAAYLKQAAAELGEREETIKQDLGRLLLALEAKQAERLREAQAEKSAAPKLSPAEYEAALAFLRDPKLLTRILGDFAAIGLVGEETNTLVGYLAAVSRQLDRPLAVIIQSSSAAGKSALMDAVLAFMPAAAVTRYSAMTGQSLFYMGETNLKHKILAIAEEEGASQAGYALKLLQSDGQVTIASTGKDPATGLLVTQEYRVEGPVMLMLTTTAIDIDEELLNRCLVLTVNESREQTRAIHALQRRRQTLEGLLMDAGREDIVQLHRHAQGLLQPLAVVNPYADRLTFLDDKTRTRRDHMKYLSLIRAVALLHQYQREVKGIEHRGKWLQYIEVTADDIATANRLAHDVLGRTLDELPPQTRKLLQAVFAWAQAEGERQGIARAELRFTRKQVRALTGWGDTQLKLHLARLSELEYLLIHRARRGQGYEYELLYEGEGEGGERFLMGLADLGAYGYDGERSGAQEARPAPGRASVGGQSALGRGAVEGREASPDAALRSLPINGHKNPRLPGSAAVLSYPSSLAAAAP